VDYSDPNENPWYDPRGVYSSCNIKGSLVLSFDDGPGAATLSILDTLKANNIKVTFFVIGSNIAGNESLLQRAYADGHTIGAHTWTHPDLTTLSSAQIISEMTKTSDEIFRVIGVRPKYMRPPYGNINSFVIDVVTGMGYKMILWNLDTLDWQISDQGGSAKQVSDAFVTYMSPYSSLVATKGWISLDHDLYQITAQALQTIINYVNGQGYVYRKINDCFGDSPYF
jgi:peptidoglycan/xylan/chitin deacetylase (PgdA/CDA1 family)